MKATNTLPEGYTRVFSVNLQKDKKAMLLINGLALLIGVVMAAIMQCIVPFSTLWQGGKNLQGFALRMGTMAVLFVAYMVLHELVHGVTMKLCGTKKVKYGFTGMYAFAGSDDYYDKKSYILIALAPVVVWGAVLAVVNLLVPKDWFWVIYFVQMYNLSGAAGDFYVTVKFSRLPKDILVQDNGVSMEVYSAEKQ